MHTPLDVISLTVVRELCANGEARALRQRHRLSLGELAAAIGSTPASVAAWESGRKRPRASAAFTAYTHILGELLALGEHANDENPSGTGRGSRKTAIRGGRNVSTG